MASTLNATTSSGIVATADNTGQLALQANGTTVMTVTSTGVTTQVGAPAFSAYGSALTSVANNTWTKIAFNTKEFDTNNNYDTTNYRFTPTVAGYYQVNACIGGPASSAGVINVSIYKNGTSFKVGSQVPNVATYGAYLPVNALIYCNGTTDYLEIYVWQNTGGTVNAGSNSSVFAFSASMVRSA